MRRGDRRVTQLFRGEREVTLALRKGRLAFRKGGPMRLPQLEFETVDDGDNTWWHVSFCSPELLDGNATDGWTDSRGYVVIRLERSEDLVSWSQVEHEDVGAPEDLGDGTWKYTARSIYPIRSATTTGQLSLVHATPDSRDNPIEGVKLGGVALTLPNFPYTLPADAAVLQADLVADGWTGATVAAVGSTGWRIDIPDVPTTASYIAASEVSWPVYYVADIFGGLTIPIAGKAFHGDFVNEDGRRTNLSKQFSRMRMKRGARILP